MLSALRASRDYVAHQLAELRSGVDFSGKQLDRPGSEFHVEPFDSNNVSTGAALVKVATVANAARRHRANEEASRQKTELETEKARAEISRIRAEAKYYEEGGARVKPRLTSVQIGDYPPGTPVEDVRLGISATKGKKGTSDSTRMNAAKAELERINAAIENDIPMHLAPAMAKLHPHIAAITGENETNRQSSLQFVRDNYGLDFSPYSSAVGGDQYPSDINTRMKMMEGELEGVLKPRVRHNLTKYYAPERAKYDSLIRSYATGQGGNEPADPDDPGGFLDEEQ